MKRSIAMILFLSLAAGTWNAPLNAADTRYQVTAMFETNQAGQVLRQSPAQGWLVLYANGTYQAQFHISDRGTYRFVKANTNQPNDTIYFQSGQNFQYFAYPRQNALAIWVRKTETGADLWYRAELSTATAPPAPSQSPQGNAPASVTNITGLIQNGVFSRTVMYGSTSAPVYNYYNEEDGSITSDEGGVILRPNGTFYIKSEIGSATFEGRGHYKIGGAQVHIVFNDGSDMVLTLVDGGKSLNWYGQGGILIAEYTFLGTLK